MISCKEAHELYLKAKEIKDNKTKHWIEKKLNKMIKRFASKGHDSVRIDIPLSCSQDFIEETLKNKRYKVTSLQGLVFIEWN